MAVVSFDNSYFSNFSSRRITSLSHGENNVGRIAAETLMRIFEGKEVSSQQVHQLHTTDKADDAGHTCPACHRLSTQGLKY